MIDTLMAIAFGANLAILFLFVVAGVAKAARKDKGVKSNTPTNSEEFKSV